jgi:hypothetical protein
MADGPSTAAFLSPVPRCWLGRACGSAACASDVGDALSAGPSVSWLLMRALAGVLTFVIST